ncbi:SusC/RagA family TonB-linked outer membrane protein [Flagellimonas aequoris]|uniref:TonB-dependent receptor n=1 Tax=Flagellimonas aequoris TaxID=2306997 RepID=A0A418N6X0_9FLAO|nr:TonB-dependent receptor [Allomuricauda aequoris]RIV70464.1 TonB-dependent receptor [Allomuricauda aequoris]TXK01892.1 TonB-dependent receptor [Allomuricauda aequoris]
MRTKFMYMLVPFLVLCMSFSFAQEKTISGNVTDQQGLPLPGVSIIVVGTSNGTQTDFDGNYSINASTGDVLRFSYVGQKTVERTVGASTSMNVIMEEDAQALEEVIVMGYATKSKADVTGSTVQLDSKQIEQIPVATVDQALQGKVAGLSITGDSGTPGSTTDIRIRGISSITAGNDPLYVIDGVPMNNPNISATTSGSSLSALASINSNNIESITVLKDASATAAYGARGANGVIVITTKSGKAGKTKFNFNSYYGFANDAIDGPTPLTGAEREMLFYEAVYNSFGETYGLNNVEEAGAFARANTSYGAAYQAWRDAGSPETNWADLITNKNAVLKEYNFSATGGDETSNFYASLGYFKQEATVIGSEFDRISGALNFTKDFSDKFTFSSNNTASYSNQDGLLENSAYFSSPRAVKYFMPSTDQAYNADGTINLDTSLPNPLWIAQEDIDDSKITRIITNNSLRWETPIKNLAFTTRANIDYIAYNYKRYRNPISGDGDGSNGYGWQASRNYTTYVFQNSLDYSFNLGEDHQFDVKVLQEWQKNRNYYLEADADNFSDVGLTNLNSAGNPTTANSTFTDWSVASYLGVVNYSAFNSKYVLNGTYRREGSSRFAKDNRWGNFWSIGAAWNMHKEGFMAGAEFINNLKLRASYGVTGNAAIALNSYQALLNFDSDYNGEGASYPGSFGNNDLSWETSNTLDLGIDFGLFQNRVSGSFAYYNRESKDLLLNVPLSLTTGFSSQTRNIGRMENKGFEVEVNFDIIRSEDFNLSIGGNVATNENEVLELAKDLNGEEINISTDIDRVESGHPVYAWYMPTWAGVNSDTGNEEWYINGVDGETTTNFNEAERVFQGGSALPKITSGMNIHVDVKGFFVDANGYYAGGHKVYEGWHRYTQGTDLYPTALYQGYNTLLDRWQQPGDEARFGKFEYTGRPWQRHSKFLYDGDYFRLKNLTIGYDFNSKFTDLLKIESLRVFVRGTNLLTWVKDDNLKYDPENIDLSGLSDGTNRGQTVLTTPPVKSVVLGVNLNF